MNAFKGKSTQNSVEIHQSGSYKNKSYQKYSIETCKGKSTQKSIEVYQSRSI